MTSIGGPGGEGGEGGGIGGDGGDDGRTRNCASPAPPMRKWLGVPAATALEERAMASASAAAMSISLSCVTERVESFASSWAATPETCGDAMLVPLMVFVAVLLEPTHAAKMLEPGACAHAQGAEGTPCGSGWAGGRWRASVHRQARGHGRGVEYLHVDARAVVGERRGSIVPIRGANKYLVKRCIFIVVQRAEIRGRVACGCHDQHLRFVQVEVENVVCVSELPQLSQCGCGVDVVLLLAALRPCRSRQGGSLTRHVVYCFVDTYNMRPAFAFRSAASSVRKPPESERCTTCGK